MTFSVRWKKSLGRKLLHLWSHSSPWGEGALSTSQSQPFVVAQVLPLHLKGVKDWDRDCVGLLLGLCSPAAMHLSLIKGFSWEGVCGYTKLAHFTERALRYLTDLMLGHRGTFSLVLGKQIFWGGHEVVNWTGIQGPIYLFLSLPSVPDRQEWQG